MKNQKTAGELFNLFETYAQNLKTGADQGPSEGSASIPSGDSEVTDLPGVVPGGANKPVVLDGELTQAGEKGKGMTHPNPSSTEPEVSLQGAGSSKVASALDAFTNSIAELALVIKTASMDGPVEEGKAKTPDAVETQVGTKSTSIPNAPEGSEIGNLGSPSIPGSVEANRPNTATQDTPVDVVGTAVPEGKLSKTASAELPFTLDEAARKIASIFACQNAGYQMTAALFNGLATNHKIASELGSVTQVQIDNAADLYAGQLKAAGVSAEEISQKVASAFDNSHLHQIAIIQNETARKLASEVFEGVNLEVNAGNLTQKQARGLLDTLGFPNPQKDLETAVAQKVAGWKAEGLSEDQIQENLKQAAAKDGQEIVRELAEGEVRSFQDALVRSTMRKVANMKTAGASDQEISEFVIKRAADDAEMMKGGEEKPEEPKEESAPAEGDKAPPAEATPSADGAPAQEASAEGGGGSQEMVARLAEAIQELQVEVQEGRMTEEQAVQELEKAGIDVQALAQMAAQAPAEGGGEMPPEAGGLPPEAGAPPAEAMPPAAPEGGAGGPEEALMQIDQALQAGKITQEQATQMAAEVTGAGGAATPPPEAAPAEMMGAAPVQ